MARVYRKFTQDDIDRAIALRAEGLSFSAIGRAIGRNANSVEHRLSRESGKTHSMGKTCADCATPIADANSTGFCRKCGLARMNSDSEFQAKRQAALRACDALKAGSSVRIEAAKKAVKTRMANPEYVSWLRDFMRRVVAPAGQTPEANAKRNYREIGRKHTERSLGWCPPEYRDEYRQLVISKGVKAADARAIILAQVRADEAKLSPFERQERALQRGAELVANDRGPMFGEAVNYGEAKWGRLAG